jgi:hypothetical protein
MGAKVGAKRPSAAITSRLRRISKKVNLWKIAAAFHAEATRYPRVMPESADAKSSAVHASFTAGQAERGGADALRYRGKTVS